MAKLFIEDTSLTAIGDAIRSKTGGNELLSVPTGMVDAINSIATGGGNIEVEPIVLDGVCDYACAGDIASNYIKLFGNTISTENVGSTKSMFEYFTLKKIPFDINMDNSWIKNMAYMFNGAYYLEELPKIYNAYPENLERIFSDCWALREIPEDYMDTWNFDRFYSYGYANMSYMFYACRSLKAIPSNILKKLYCIATRTYYQFYYGTFEYCYVLGELNGLAVTPEDISITSNIFYQTFGNCGRLKSVTFDTNEDGTPKVVKWANQTIELVDIGYNKYVSDITSYNSGLTEETRIIDGDTWEALKDNPDSWTTEPFLSRYTHKAAVETINSLPDTSAFLSSNGGTNTIKFSSMEGLNTDGGPGELTEEEIAVAAAKGWTVTFV